MSAVVNGDVRVVGLVAGNHLIEDISRDVPYGVVIVIPGELALQSKDLWRSISQKFLYRLPTIPTTQATPMPDQEKLRLERYAKELEGHVTRLEAENRDLREQMKRSDSGTSNKLDSILAALQAGIPVAGVMATALRGNDPAQKVDFVDGSAPTFLPSEIRPKDMEARIDIQPESASSGVSEAAERLRKLRKGNNQ